MPFLTEDPRDLSHSSLLEEGNSVFFKSATRFESTNTQPTPNQSTSVGSNLPTGNAKQYETAFTDATGNPNYTPGVPVFVQGAYTLKNGGKTISVFEDLRAHWEGSSWYTGYRYASNQRARTIKRSTVKGDNINPNLPENTPDNIKSMISGKGGSISYLKNGDPSRVVYDVVFYLDGEYRCPLPSPIDGEIRYVGEGSMSSTEIKGPEGRVRMLHMDNFLVKKGEKVVEGQIIGRQSDKMNSRGIAPNVHLHIECPEKVLRKYIKKMLNGSYVPGAKTPKTKEEKSQEVVDNVVQGVKDFFGSWGS